MKVKRKIRGGCAQRLKQLPPPFMLAAAAHCSQHQFIACSAQVLSLSQLLQYLRKLDLPNKTTHKKKEGERKRKRLAGAWYTLALTNPKYFTNLHVSHKVVETFNSNYSVLVTDLSLNSNVPTIKSC